MALAARGVLYAGASGWSYPSWRGGFYPAGARPAELLRLYAERLPSVEVNTTGYRLPSAAQLERWADAVPPRFRFALKAPPWALRSLADFEARVAVLGERLGPIRLVVGRPRDDRLLALLTSSRDPSPPYALDLRHPSWRGVDVAPAVAVGDLERRARFRYLRFRDPPYDEAGLRGIAAAVERELAAGRDVHAYFRHEREPSAPLYAERLLALCTGATAP